jgi:Na+/proline symporter
LPGLADENQALPELVAQVLPEGVRALIMTAIIAATMSTSSSFLAAASSLAVQDLYEPILGHGASEDRQIFHSRVITALFAAISLGISLVFPGVVSLVVFATLVAPAAIFIPFILSIFWDRTPAQAGFWAILASAAAGCTSQIFWYEQVGGWLGAIHPLFVAPLAALAVIIPVALLQKGTDAGSNNPGSALAERNGRSNYLNSSPRRWYAGRSRARAMAESLPSTSMRRNATSTWTGIRAKSISKVEVRTGGFAASHSTGTISMSPRVTSCFAMTTISGYSVRSGITI